ncbi:MAG: hypothetical protein ABSC64_02160 [Candidatus Korobacteraceae bacterium]
MSQYIYYKFNTNSTTITNYGAGQSAYNGKAARNQYVVDPAGHPAYGPLNAASDGILVPGGISNPYQHTWQFGIWISQWWPGLGCQGSDTQWGNDGKLWSAANDMFYGYLHGVTDPGAPKDGQGCLDGISDTYNFTVEIAYNESPDYSDDSVQFWLGTGNSAPVNQGTAETSDETRIYWVWETTNLQLHTYYYFQVVVDLPDASQWATGNNYAIGNCIEVPGGCNDAGGAQGFPCGSYIYAWREDNTALSLPKQSNWADDVGCWGGPGSCGGGSPTPAPTPTPTPTPSSSTPTSRCNLALAVNVRTWQPKNM